MVPTHKKKREAWLLDWIGENKWRNETKPLKKRAWSVNSIALSIALISLFWLEEYKIQNQMGPVMWFGWEIVVVFLLLYIETLVKLCESVALPPPQKWKRNSVHLEFVNGLAPCVMKLEDQKSCWGPCILFHCTTWPAKATEAFTPKASRQTQIWPLAEPKRPVFNSFKSFSHFYNFILLYLRSFPP